MPDDLFFCVNLPDDFACINIPQNGVYINKISKLQIKNSVKSMILNLKKIVFAAIISSVVACGSSDKGELTGVKGGSWKQPRPYGMALVPGGAFIMGNSDYDKANSQDASLKTVTVRSFYMDETEITNSEYRQFVNWVRDSIVRRKLAVMAEEMGQTSGNQGIAKYAFLGSNTQQKKISVYDKYMVDNYGNGDSRKVNNKVKLIWDKNKYPDEFYAEVMDSMYIPVNQMYNGKRPLDVNKLIFKYQWMDMEAAARSKNGKRSDFVKEEIIKVYPDTTVWIKDFDYSYNEPMHNDYFWHQAYGDYPVVGVTWKQAKAFCEWRTIYKNSYLKGQRQDVINAFRLPTEAEWEFAARGGLESATYPWGGPYTIDKKGCFMANFKPQRGDYAADKYLYTVEAKSFAPNGYNLYNMAGNVSEWTNTSYEQSSYDYMSTMNPNVNDGNNKRKVIRGGSWKDVAYYLQVNARDYEYQDSARSYIGFRTVQDFMGAEKRTNTANQSSRIRRK